MASGDYGHPCAGVRRTRAQQCRHRARRHWQWAALGSTATPVQGFGSRRCTTGLRARCRAPMWLTTGAWGSGQWRKWAQVAASAKLGSVTIGAQGTNVVQGTGGRLTAGEAQGSVIGME